MLLKTAVSCNVVSCLLASCRFCTEQSDSWPLIFSSTFVFLDPEGGSQNDTLVVLVLLVVVISSLKIPNAFVIHSAVQCNETLHTYSCSNSLQIYRLRFLN